MPFKIPVARLAAYLLLAVGLATFTISTNRRADALTEREANRALEVEYSKRNVLSERQGLDMADEVPSQPKVRPARQVIFLGIDGMDMDAVDEFIRRGKMPTFAEFKKTGAWGLMSTDYGDSPISWTTMATGVNCEKHGICPEGADNRVSHEWTAEAIRYPRMWEVLSKYDLHSRVISYHLLPVQMQAQYGVPMGDNPNSLDLSPEVKRNAEQYGLTGPVVWSDESHMAFGNINDQLLGTETKFKLVGRSTADLVVAHFQNTDEAGHSEWAYFQALERGVDLPDQVRQRSKIGVELLEDVYANMDRHVGEIRKMFPDALIVAASDHGMTTQGVGFSVLLELQFMKLLGVKDWDAQFPATGETFRIEGMDAWMTFEDEELNAMNFNNIFEVHRHGPKLVFTGADATRAADRTISRLAEFRLLDVSVFEKSDPTTIRVSREFFDRWYDMPTVAGEYLMVVTTSGVHMENVDGVIFLDGPGVVPGTHLRGAYLPDVAETIYAYLGVPLAKDSDGRVLEEAFNKKDLPGLKLQKVANYGVAPLYAAAANQQRRDIPDDQINYLKSLGYLN
ncbi:MAG: alkaline phosphatase family protein [Deltaproteobacteria bacterium]|nr:alkaline phosphatase family protein [Deltaproteobacteria bacterium]MCB9489454.1 alkaline phosphatase family protein [Deltaproteobacteria bacterium]